MTALATGEDDQIKSSMRKVALTALAGTSIEWYDFFLYATAAALVFPSAFFPDSSPTIGLILSFGTFAFGFIARPLGGVLFGHFGDRIGRKKTLVIALVMMGIASTLIGLLPTYATIGIAAPILLSLLRFAQGLAIGGQWGGAMLLVTESAPADQRGYYGAYAQAGAGGNGYPSPSDHSGGNGGYGRGFSEIPPAFGDNGYFCAGGGGCRNSTSGSNGAGGPGGGGDGGGDESKNPMNLMHGDDKTGGGGGGRRDNSEGSGRGGTGVIIIRVPAS